MRVIAACLPASDAGFSERVRRVIGHDRWDLASPEGIGLIQAVLRKSYPMATVVGHDGVWSAGVRRTIVLDVYRDGTPDSVDQAIRWMGAVYDLGGPAAYRAAARILGDGSAAEHVVEHAFNQIRRSGDNGTSVAAGAAAVEATATDLAHAARTARTARAFGAIDVSTMSPPPQPALAETALRKGPVRRVLSGAALACVTSSQREVLELSLLEDLKVTAIADRMQSTPAAVRGELNDALVAVTAGIPLSAQATLAGWREAQQRWASLPAGDRARPARSLAVAHAWLDYQVASHAVSPQTVVLVTDMSRRFVTASANAGGLLGRPSVVGVQIDDVTADYARPLVSELWTVFDLNGAMAGEYDCDRPGRSPIRIPFRGIWGRPIPDLQVGYLEPPSR